MPKIPKMPKLYSEMNNTEFRKVYEESWNEYLFDLGKYKLAVENGEMKYSFGKSKEDKMRNSGDKVALVCIEMRRRLDSTSKFYN